VRRSDAVEIDEWGEGRANDWGLCVGDIEEKRRDGRNAQARRESTF
jgi:hypothetical protein